MIAIFKREVRSYFQNVVGWLFIAVVLAVYGLYYYVYNLRSGYPYIHYALSAVTILLMIAIPVLTMRSFSEEKKNRTDQLILTSPVSIWKIVLGKYFAMLFIYSLDILFMGITPLVLKMFGTVPFGESYIALLGFWLYGASCIAVGMFISSLTESQVIAAVLTFVALFVSYMMENIANLISTDETIITKILNKFDLYTPFEGFTAGCLDLTGILYYVSVIFLFCFFTVQAIQKRRYQITRKKLSLGAFSSGIIAATVAVVVIVNFLISSMPQNMTSIDCSYNKMYSITDKTKTFLSGLKEDVTIYVLAAKNSKDDTVAETLNRYEALSNHIKVVYKNPSKYPYFYKDYTDTAPNKNSLIVVAKDSKRSRVIDYNDLYEYDYSMDYSTYSYNSTIKGYDAEGQLTSALEYVSKAENELPVIYTIKGHDETAIGSQIKEVFEKANITIKDLKLFNEESVPEDAAAIIINAPQQDFNEADAKKVIDYLKKGGKAIIAAGYESVDLNNFASILANYNVSLEKGVLTETDSNYYYGQPIYLLPDVLSTDYTKDAYGKYVYAPVSTAVNYPEETDDGSATTYIPFLSTTEKAVEKKNVNNMTTYDFEDGDLQGKFTVGLAIEDKVSDDISTKLVVIGNPYIFDDDTNQTVSGNHANMFSDIAGQLIDQSNLSTSVIAAKEYTLGNVTVPVMKAVSIGLTIMILIPIVMLLIGIIYWAKRRKR